jgi:hypothetical protein
MDINGAPPDPSDQPSNQVADADEHALQQSDDPCEQPANGER